MSFLTRLDGVELAQVRFHLAFHAAYSFPRTQLLHLRRELLRAAHWSQEMGDPAAGAMLQLLDPAPPVDPVLRHRVQKPSPPFAFTLPAAEAIAGDPGAEFQLEAVLPGSPVQTTLLLAQLLTHLGTTGLFRVTGRFTLTAISARGHDGVWVRCWRAGASLDELSMPLLNLRWLLEEQLEPEAGWQFRFVTPARLLSRGRPLFHIDSATLAPFLLRRVTSVLATAAALDPWEDADALLLAMRSLDPVSNDLHWSDWRVLDGDAGAVDLGGVVGTLRFRSLISEEIQGVFFLASLFNIGRGASFGAGHFQLERWT